VIRIFPFFYCKKREVLGVGKQNEKRKELSYMETRDSPIIYICSKYSGDIEQNTEMARRYSRLAFDRGFVPITPHLLFPQFLSEETEREKALAADLRILSVCQELWVCGEVSSGMKLEIEEAGRSGLPVRYVRKEELQNV
jgi:hypothetical protein